MTTTTSTEAKRLDQVRATLNIALHQITGHLVDHQLPPPVAINLPSHGNPHVDVRIHDFQYEAWLLSGIHPVTDGMQVREGNDGTYVTVTQEIRLASGVVLRLVWAERRTTGLRAVH